MLKILHRTASAFLVAISLAPLSGEGLAAEDKAPLTLETIIPLPGVAGRIDHMAVDLIRRRLYVAELGNNSLDVVDLTTESIVHRISGLSEPQGVGYSKQTDLLFVANGGDGTVRLFQAADFTPAGTIPLGQDADNVRVDPRTGFVVVGFGEGGLALIDPKSRATVSAVPLPDHPESFRIDPATDRAFVNVPDAGEIAVVDLNAGRTVAHWTMRGLTGNFPMALNATSGLLAVVFRGLPLLALLNTAGRTVSEAKTCGDADDVFFDEHRKRIYVSCGAGEVAIWQMEGGSIRPLPSVRTAIGSRTSLFVSEIDRLFVAKRAGPSASAAAILVYRPMP